MINNMNNIKDLVVRVESAKQESDPELEALKLQAKKELIELNGREKFFTLMGYIVVQFLYPKSE